MVLITSRISISVYLGKDFCYSLESDMRLLDCAMFSCSCVDDVRSFSAQSLSSHRSDRFQRKVQTFTQYNSHGITVLHTLQCFTFRDTHTHTEESFKCCYSIIIPSFTATPENTILSHAVNKRVKALICFLILLMAMVSQTTH